MILSEPEVVTVTEAVVAAFVFGRSPMHPEKNINPTSKRWPKWTNILVLKGNVFMVVSGCEIHATKASVGFQSRPKIQSKV